MQKWHVAQTETQGAEGQPDPPKKKSWLKKYKITPPPNSS